MGNLYLWNIQEHRLRVFENRVLRRIFGSRRNDVTGSWRKLHNEYLYSSPSIIIVIKSKRMRWAGYVARIGTRSMRIGYWWENPERKRSLGRPKRRWMDNIKIDLREIIWYGTLWIGLMCLRIGTSGRCL
jgi:hypothetical protein